MADQFDIVDIVYDAIEPAVPGFVLYKDRSGDGESKDHITVRPLALNEQDAVNKGMVNVNVFVKRRPKGMFDRSLMKATVRSLKSALRNITPPVGMYWKSRIVWSEPMDEAKEGFDCMNIRLEVITELD